jgi:probable phosphoglycerate mutase
VLDELGEDGLDDLHDRFDVSRRWDEFPYSEPSRDIAARAMGALREVVSASAGERVVVVTHTGVINTIVSEIVGSRFHALFYPAHASFSRLAWGRDRLVVRTLNDYHHMTSNDLVTY